MSKEKSLMLKGVAILMMVFLHLFNNLGFVAYCHPLLYVGDKPLAYIITRACVPVGFFLMLSGYGLDCLYTAQRDMGLKAQGRRLLKLFVAYWLILLIFVSIGSFVRPEKYPGDAWEMIGNLTSWKNSYNAEHWFLFPYTMLSITALYIFKLVDKLGRWKSVALFGFLYLVSGYIISRYIAVEKSYDSVFAHFITYIELTFEFVLGALLHRVSVERGLKIERLAGKNVLVLSLLLLLITAQCFITTGVFGFLYLLCFIVLFLQLRIGKVAATVLQFLGKYSMVMWLTHSFFCYHLFHDFIYSFDNPLFIFIVLMAITIAVSIPIKWIADKIVSVMKL